MDDFGQNAAQSPVQIIEKPTSVMVFGVLNCVFGGLGLICSPFSILGIKSKNGDSNRFFNTNFPRDLLAGVGRRRWWGVEF